MQIRKKHKIKRKKNQSLEKVKLEINNQLEFQIHKEMKLEEKKLLMIGGMEGKMENIQRDL